MLKAIRANDKGVICSFVGTGKSRVKSVLVRENNGHSLLVFPSLNLVDQFVSRHAPDAFVLTVEQPKTPAKIKEHFSKADGVVAVTYQSLHKLRRYFNRLSLALFDEAHHICTNRVIDLLEDL
jgi:superfamily II DNA or RNA helicase